jgi:hypothetical protein
MLIFSVSCAAVSVQTTSNQMVRATALFYGVLFLHCRPIIF